MIVESRAAAAYWRRFQDAGLRERKNGNLPRSWMRFAQRGKGKGFFGPKHAAHPINAMLNYCYVVEAGRLAKALAAQGLALPIGYLHSDKKGAIPLCGMRSSRSTQRSTPRCSGSWPSMNSRGPIFLNRVMTCIVFCET